MKQLGLNLAGTGGYTQEQVDKFLEGFGQLDFGVPDAWCHCNRCEYGRAVTAIQNNDPAFDKTTFAVKSLNKICRAFTPLMIKQMKTDETADPFSRLSVLRHEVLK